MVLPDKIIFPKYRMERLLLVWLDFFAVASNIVGMWVRPMKWQYILRTSCIYLPFYQSEPGLLKPLAQDLAVISESFSMRYAWSSSVFAVI